METVRYHLVNLFAEQPFAGSPLAVVTDAEGLSTGAMQRIARELGAPETAFVLPPERGGHYRVRVFTPGRESPFGGHSCIGTAVTLVRLGRLSPGQVIQECGARRHAVEVTGDRATLTAAEPLPAEPLPAEPLVAACSLAAGDVVAPPAALGFAVRFHYLPVRLAALSRARVDVEHMRRAALADVIVVAWDPDSRTARVRVFAPGYEMPEDPACASAALGLGLYLVQLGWLPAEDGVHEHSIVQGIELERPALLTCATTVSRGQAIASRVSGRVVATAHGEICTGGEP